MSSVAAVAVTRSTAARAAPPAATFSVWQTARRAGVSVRTVREDIAAGRLPIYRGASGRIHVPLASLERYRLVRYRERSLLTALEVSQLLNITIRTVRRRVARGEYVTVKVSPRCIRIDAQRSAVLTNGDGSPTVFMAELLEDAELRQSIVER